MSEYETDVEEQEEAVSIWDMMEVDEPDDEYEEEQTEQDEETAKLEKLDKKFSAKMDKREKQFEATILREKVGMYEKSASELELDLFKALASDIKTLADFDKAVRVVNARAQKMEAATQKYREQMEAAAAGQAAMAWGTGPVGTPTPKMTDHDKEVLDRIAAGDERALFDALIGDNPPWRQ